MKNWIRQNRHFLIFLVCFGVFRFAVADWNPIPSGSMRPSLLEGDVVLVDRLAYSLKIPLTDVVLLRLGDPQRGDVVTFSSPDDGTRLIKRIVAVGGDRVEMRDDHQYVNGLPMRLTDLSATREPLTGTATTAIRGIEHFGTEQHAVQFLPAVPARRSFGPLVVPRDAVFCLGDNRDNSADSRYFGFVARRLLIGRAHHILVSADITGNWLPRLERFGARIE
jgi:signal peptidase I